MEKNEASAISNALIALRVNVEKLAAIQRTLVQEGNHRQALALKTTAICIANESNKLLAVFSDSLVEAAMNDVHEVYAQLMDRVTQCPEK